MKPTIIHDIDKIPADAMLKPKYGIGLGDYAKALEAFGKAYELLANKPASIANFNNWLIWARLVDVEPWLDLKTMEVCKYEPRAN